MPFQGTRGSRDISAGTEEVPVLLGKGIHRMLLPGAADDLLCVRAGLGSC